MMSGDDDENSVALLTQLNEACRLSTTLQRGLDMCSSINAVRNKNVACNAETTATGSGHLLARQLDELRHLYRQLETSLERNSELRELVERRLRGGIVSPQSEADDWPSWPRRVETDHHHLQRVESELRRLGAENEALRARQLTSDRMLQTAQHTNDSLERTIKSLREQVDEKSQLVKGMKLELDTIKRAASKAHRCEKKGEMTEDWSNHPDNDEDDKLLSAEVMGEVRRLRLQLQLCIDNNDQLRQRLEDCARHHHAPPPSRCGSCARPLTGVSQNSVEKATVGKEADKMDPVQLGHHTQAATASITAEQSVYAVLTLDNFMLLRTENDYSISVLQQIESANESLFKEQTLVDGGVEAELAELMSAVRRSVHTQKYLLSLCWVTTLPTSHAADGFAILLQENGMLKRRLSDLQQKLSATKRSMKSVHERLEANNHRKEELIVSLRRSRDTALIDQLTKTHEAVTQSKCNLQALNTAATIVDA